MSNQFKFSIDQIVFVDGIKCQVTDREIDDDRPDYLLVPLEEVEDGFTQVMGIELPGWVRTNDISLENENE